VFELSVEGEKALLEVKDAIDRAKIDLPNDLPADPSVMEMDFSEFPVMNVNVSGDYPQNKLKEYAEHLLSVAALVSFFFMIYDSIRQAKPTIRNNFVFECFTTF
jgi:hypothetical protein